MLKLASAIFTTGFAAGAATVVLAIKQGRVRIVAATEAPVPDVPAGEEPADDGEREPVAVNAERPGS